MTRLRATHRAILLTAVLAFSASAANWTLIRRTAQVGACIASAADGYSTSVAINAGGREGNPLFRTSTGGVNYGRLITFKSVTCMAPIVISEVLLRRHPERPEYVGAAGSAVLAGVFSWATVHNYGVANQMNQRRAVPEYLK